MNMKKCFLALATLLLTFHLSIHAQEERNLGYFNSLSIGVNAGTTGVGFDLATPIGNHFALRAGITIVPNLSLTEDVDVTIPVDYSSTHYDIPTSIEVEGAVGRTAGEVLLNIYPFKRSSFFISGGAAFGGDKLIKVKGHSDELAKLQDITGGVGIEIGDYMIPVDKEGNVSGGIKVASFRPFVGLGFGRIVPKKRVGFLFEMGVQFHNTPEVYTDYGQLDNLIEEADNEFTDILNELTIYPVIRFRLCGKLF